MFSLGCICYEKETSALMVVLGNETWVWKETGSYAVET